VASDLTPTQRTCLRALVDLPGRFPHSYPGGARSVHALTRRGLARIERVNTAGVMGDAAYPTTDAYIVVGPIPREVGR
jgi:hypothetical protein